MDPVAFRFFGIDIMWYAVLIMAGVLLGLLVAKFNTTRADLQLSFDDFLDAFLYAFPLAIIGARLYYVAFEWSNYKDHLIEILNIRGGGLAIHGGLIGAVAGVILYKVIKKKPTAYMLSLADAAAPGLILAQAVGRWGNFMNQEAHGGPVTKEFIQQFPAFIQEGMYINGQYFHPTFLYESTWNILMGILLIVLFWKRKKHHEGTILAWYMILYSLGRFFIESLRTDSLWVGGLRTAQLISVIMGSLGILYLIYQYTRKPKEMPAPTEVETDPQDVK
ncbi:Prolipoprotein diacylglyceryl transferase [bioreactor metagenome]|uniref:Prolipoprotein diacylglyceryl transferase n=1 Tax=bioreactor metagenome TaxID=1076179 RepID=A0A645DJW1_9ZZZZ|nr:prolipoprotein diacylglyceryl transferase [Proteiniclasticum sp. QWL-01]UUM11681.1 prolipoprotein diacylglyceryl transferase [Clostridiaceae bacterium HFYG-1003]WFF73152.1 prolipoprotein diacylglyceryl transferase [Proteiniclasticum sp. QWL-01]